MIRWLKNYAAVCAIALTHGALMADQPIPRYDATTDFILQYAMVAAMPLNSPIGREGRACPGFTTEFYVIYVRPSAPSIAKIDATEVREFFQWQWALAEAWKQLLTPGGPDFNPKTEQLFCRGNYAVLDSMPIPETKAELKAKAWKVFTYSPDRNPSFFDLVVTKAKELATPAAGIPAAAIKAFTDENALAEPAIDDNIPVPRGRCQIFRYCVTSHGPRLVKNTITSEQRAAFQRHQELLATDDQYRQSFNGVMTLGYLIDVRWVNRPQAAEWVKRMYLDLASVPFYHQLCDQVSPPPTDVKVDKGGSCP